MTSQKNAARYVANLPAQHRRAIDIPWVRVDRNCLAPTPECCHRKPRDDTIPLVRIACSRQPF